MERWKIVILDGKRLFSNDATLDGLQTLGEVTLHMSTSATEVVNHISDNNIILVDELPITRDTIRRCPSIRMIAVLSTGFNHIDLDAAQEYGILVCNVPGYSASSVAQLTTALLLEIFNNVGKYNTAIHAGKWSNNFDCKVGCSPITEVAGKKVGVIGYGSIGKIFSQIMGAMGATVIVYTRHHHLGTIEANTRFVSLNELLSESDIISLHCPLNKDSFELINGVTIKKMKKGVVLLNTARGALINEQDVADALCSGKIGALGQDVFIEEPVTDKSPLLQAPNTYLTPHIGWNTKEARQKLIDIATENVRCYISGRPQNIVSTIPDCY